MYLFYLLLWIGILVTFTEPCFFFWITTCFFWPITTVRAHNLIAVILANGYQRPSAQIKNLCFLLLIFYQLFINIVSFTGRRPRLPGRSSIPIRRPVLHTLRRRTRPPWGVTETRMGRDVSKNEGAWRPWNTSDATFGKSWFPSFE